MMAEINQSSIKWSEDEQVCFVDGYGWGLTENLKTIPLGKEEDIKHFFETGDMKEDLNPLQRGVLADIRKYREELLSEQSGFIPKKSGAVRGRPIGTTKHRTINLRYAKTRKRVAIH